ncbi:hypothetical protein F66182_967 [Fusarium sp. NRRL 66182]|nr:hypothetical protein F66182_967 [Fusarium sp. NRRL 66182]
MGFVKGINKPRQSSMDINGHPDQEDVHHLKQENIGSGEVFDTGQDGVNFRTVKWPHASMIFLKAVFATGVLALPSSLHSLGVIPGAFAIVMWQVINTYCALILGEFRSHYPHCHSIADMAHVIGGPVLYEITGFLFIVGYIICAASGVVGISVGLNALSEHAICTTWFSVIAMVLVAMIAGVRKFEKIAWFTWVGFLSIFVAVLIIVIGVTTLDRPAAAPQTGDYDLGYRTVAPAHFVPIVVALTNIFCASSASSAFVPVIAEMTRPQDYSKAAVVSMSFVGACYLSMSLVVYRWCGQWVASPSLGSAGPLLKKAAYGVGFPGLLISAGLWAHVGAKYLFVRLLRKSRHLTDNSFVHWGTWIACVVFMAVSSFLVASGVPIFDYVLAIAGSLAFAPLALILPGALWMHLHSNYWLGGVWRTSVFVLHCLLMSLGAFITVAGAYGVIQLITDAYADGPKQAGIGLPSPGVALAWAAEPEIPSTQTASVTAHQLVSCTATLILSLPLEPSTVAVTTIVTMSFESEGIVARGPFSDGKWAIEPLTLRPLRQDEVLVEMVASGICHTDLHCGDTADDLNVPSVYYPRVLGHEGSGYVVQVGSQVTHVRPGDAVLLSFSYCGDCHVCKTGPPSHCVNFFDINFMGEPVFSSSSGQDIGGRFFGQSSLARHSIVSSKSVVNVHGLGLTRDELQILAPFGCGLQTGSGTVINVSKATADDCVTIAGMGGVGLAAVMAASKTGCRVIIGIDRIESRLTLAKSLGATHVINTTGLEMSQVVDKIKKAADGLGSTISIDTSAYPPLLTAQMEATRYMGQIIQVGTGMPEANVSIHLQSFMVSGKRYFGAVQGHARTEEYIPQMIQWWRDGSFPLEHLIKQFDSVDFVKAIEAMRSGEVVKPIIKW